jgi:sodium-dependent dicarboxylate transporter 2/3/5
MMDKAIQNIIIALLLAVATYFVAGTAFNEIQARLLGSVVFLVALWTNEALPMGVVAMIPIILFPALEIATTNEVAPNYAKSIIFLFVGGFLLAIAVEKTGLHKVIASHLLRRFPTTPRGIILALLVTSALMSSFLSNTTTSLLLLPVALFLTDNLPLKIRFVLAIAYGANIGGIITPIGTAPNMLLLGFLEGQGIEPIAFMKWIVLTFPLAIVMLGLISLVLSYRVNHLEVSHGLDQKIVMDREQKRLSWILGALVVLLLVNSPIKPYYDGLGLNERGMLLFFGLLMFVPKLGFLTWEDSKKIPYEIIFLFGAGFSIAFAFTHTQLANEIASSLQQFTSSPDLLIILIVATLVVFSTEITSNTALTSVALPIIFALGNNAAIDTTLILMVATISASYAFMLPTATPPNAIAMSSRVITIKQMASFGFVINIIAIIMITIVAMSYWSVML